MLYIGGMEKTRYNRLPRVFVPVGGTTVVGRGVVLRCVARPRGLHWTECCRDCWLRTRDRGCYDLQCSSFDREDKVNVWFVKEG